MAEFTPGPYKAWDLPCAGWQIGTVSAPEGCHGNVACLAWYQMRNGGAPSNTEEQDKRDAADAHLLATSWKMYHVLDYALAALKHCFHAHDSGVDGICLEIEAVMAEARGEATP